MYINNDDRSDMTFQTVDIESQQIIVTEPTEKVILILQEYDLSKEKFWFLSRANFSFSFLITFVYK